MLKYITLLSFIFSSAYAQSQLELAQNSELEGNLTETINHLLNALENPQEDQLKVRTMLQYYFEILGEKEMADQNQDIIDQLKTKQTISEQRSEVLKTEQEISSDQSWTNTLAINALITRTPFESTVNNLYTTSVEPELSYSLNYGVFKNNLFHDLDMGVEYEFKSREVSYEQSGNQYIRTVEKGSISNEYFLNLNLSYSVYSRSWYLGTYFEGAQSADYDFFLTNYSFFGYSPYMNNHFIFNLNGTTNYSQEFGYGASLGSKFTFKTSDNKSKVHLGYNFHYHNDDPAVNNYIYATSLTANSTTPGTLVEVAIDSINQTYIKNSIFINSKFQLLDYVSFSTNTKYSLSTNLSPDLWHEIDSSSLSVSRDDSQSGYQLGDWYYNSELDLNEQEINSLASQQLFIYSDYILNQQWYFKFAFNFELTPNQSLDLNSVLIFEQDFGLNSDLTNHPTKDQNWQDKYYLNLGYELNF